MEKLDAARAALSHARPGATPEEILEAGLDLVLAERAKSKGVVANPRKEPPPSKPDSHHIPAHVKRAVWSRDGGRCQYPLEGGGVCGSKFQVEFDHIRPRALGGPSTIENIRCACRPHNGLAARRVFGDAWMDQFRRKNPGQNTNMSPKPSESFSSDRSQLVLEPKSSTWLSVRSANR
jgi:hypothetical protein